MNDHRRNYVLLFMDTVLFMNAMTFLSVNAVITYFLAHLKASTFEIGLVNALVSIGAFVSQPFFAKKVMNLTHKAKTFVRILFIQRIVFLLFVLTIPLVAESHPKLMVLLFLAGWGVFNLFVGAYGPFFMSLFAKLVAESSRGRLRGFSSGAGSLLALGSSALCGVILSKVPYPYNYTLIFAIGVVLLLLDVLTFAMMKEMEPDAVTKVDFNYFQYFKAIPAMFREFKAYQRTVIGFSCTVAAQAGLAYYTLYAVRTFDAGSTAIAMFTAITGLANIAGSMVFGILADRIGHRPVLVMASAAGGLACGLIILFPSLWTIYGAFALTNLCVIGYNLSSGILILEQIPRERLPMGISINAMITLCVSSIVMIGSSWLADYISFNAVFLIAGLAGLAGAVVLRSGGKAEAPAAAAASASRAAGER
ncbi:MFS transporter [Paenibacillus filicis]|uniref:MFS transporter n=1 Tax=Paenibacillus gyeongsangnamensis TaxID=3388067 RepID=A0ABT4Q745_9BACL|nr:MFS transporter [Paenibacillus filicis]MCZ8512654.1 MFS transporter [Paenibacillus filicis]